MSKFGESQAIRRVEDLRLLTGAGRFIDDIAPKDALVAWFFRSPVAHARITGLDLDAARDVPGVHLVLSADDLRAAGVILTMKGERLKLAGGGRGAGPDRPVLADGRVRYVSEPVACVIADSIDAARDAADLIRFDYDELPAKTDLAPGGPALHDDVPDNLAFDWSTGDAAATEAALAASARRVSLRVLHNRVIVNAMEPRGAFAEMQDGRLHFAFNGQGVWGQKAELARMLKMRPDDVRVTTPDVGGGFGMKAMTYPEYVVISAAARMLNRAVRWMSDRTEAMLSDNGARDLVAEAELGFDADHRITAYRVNVLSNLGAYNSQFGQAIQSELFAKVLTGIYDIQTVHLAVQGIYTNTVQVDAYRGAGRPEAIYTLERVIDHAARVLGVDPWDLRDRNAIRTFPYRSATGEMIDVGDFPRVMRRLKVEADIAGFAARKADSARRGLLRGMGLCTYIEAILGDAKETAKVAFNPDGTVSLFVGTQSNGQGHETVFAQFLSDRTGIPLSAIRVVQGDSDLIAQGGGTGGSRSVTVQSSATLTTVEAMIAAFTPFLTEELGAEATFDDGAFRAPGSNRTLTLIEAADLARKAGRTDLLTHERSYTLPGRSYPNGAHLAEVEVDPETGAVHVHRYTVTDDFGNLMHPMLAEGQVHGGVAQGIGQAITENAVYDENGQLLTATFMDYAMPRADDVPWVVFTTEPVPSTANPMGMKGCGEAGTVGALAAVTNAVLDALWDRGVRHVDMPATPQRVWQWLQEAKTGAL